MKKEQIISEIEQALNSGEISRSDLAALLQQNSVSGFEPAAVANQGPEPENNLRNKVSTILFTAGGLIAFLAFQYLLDSSGLYTQDSLSTVAIINLLVFVVLWSAGFFVDRLSKSDNYSLVNALVGVGSLSVILAAYQFLQASDTKLYQSGVFESFGGSSLIVITLSLILLIVSSVHLVFNEYVKSARWFLVNAAILIFAAAMSMFTLSSIALVEESSGSFIFTLALFAAILTGFTTVCMAKILKKRHKEVAFDAFCRLVMVYVFIFMIISIAVTKFWAVLMLFIIGGLFYFQAKNNSKKFLIIASIFLVIDIFALCVSLKIPMAISLFVAAGAIIWVGAMLSYMSRKKMFDK